MRILLMLALVVFVNIEIFSEESTYKYENGKVITWNNQLPETIKSITKVEYFAEIIMTAKENEYNVFIMTKLENSKVYILINIDDKDLYKDKSICVNDKLSLVYPYFYMTYLNKWFFKDKDSLPSNMQKSLYDLDYIYLFQFEKNGNTIQVSGNITTDYHGIPGMDISPLILVSFPRSKNNKLYGVNGIENILGSYYITLSKLYNFVTKEYYISYLVYKFFDRNDVLMNIPELF